VPSEDDPGRDAEPTPASALSSDATEPDDRVIAAIGIGGLIALALGLDILARTASFAFDPSGAIGGVFGQIRETLPAGVVVFAIAIVEVLTGAFLIRLVRRAAFPSWADAILAGMVGAVLKDVVLLATLGQLGLFIAPAIFAVDIVILFAGRWARPLVVPGVRSGFQALIPEIRRAFVPLVLLGVVVWLGPLSLQLASPVVPFIDVLPNHVAPAEHLRTFGSFTPLTATQSPIYGPSRTLLGFTAFAGAVTTLAGLPAALAIAGLIVPTTILVGVGIHRVASAIGGPGAGWWSLLTFAMTASFARLGDVRATVVVLPIVAWSFVFIAGHLDGRGSRTVPGGDVPGGGRSRLPESVLAGLGLGTAVLVHPVIGALAVASAALLTVLLPARIGRFGITAVVVGGVLGLPQALTMIGVGLPAIALLGALAAAIAIGLALDRAPAMTPRPPPERFWAVAALAAGLLGVAMAIGVLFDESVATLVGSNGLLLGAALVGVPLVARASRSPLLLAAATAGLAVAIVTVFIPAKQLGLLGSALRFELPKTLYYWLPVVAAIAAGSTLARLWHGPVPLLGGVGRLRVLAVALFVLFASAPVRLEPYCPVEGGGPCVDAFWLGDHRLAEDLAMDLHFAQRGFWVGYPDRRRVVDAPRAELVARVRAEIAAGRIGADTPILHVAKNFQQWAATPLGVFTGVTETDVTLETEHSIHTVGGRLYGLESLPGMLGSRAYPYLLLEPYEEMPPELRPSIVAAGYEVIYANGQGELFRLGGV
jgi:hypothetical protein